MADRDLKKLGRGELLELLLESEKQCAAMKEELDGKNKEITLLQKQLEDRSIKLDQAGSIAEAALKVNGVYEAAEKAAADYLENIRSLSERQETLFAEREQKSIQDSEQRIQKSIQDSEQRMQETARLCNEMQQKTEEECRNMEETTRTACEKATAAAKTEVENYWNSLSEKLEDFYKAHEGIKEILNLYEMKLPGRK